VGLYNASDPAVLRLIDMALEMGQKKSIPVDLCGQMSGNPVYTMLLLGMGLQHFSVTPAAIPEIKKVCRSVSIEHCRTVAARARTMENARDIRGYLKEELRRAVPELGQ
jgi:phosphotransferase system enzyme I (PtsI)